jgi:mannose-1-phosphate guanylyltransferase/mannose-6-phosphate isomerase
MIQVTPVILCGGSGTRLWPLSRTGFPKQFLCLTGNESLFQQAAQRLAALGNDAIQVGAPVIVSGEDHRFLASEQLREVGISLGTALLEPTGRNTAPALTLAALAAVQNGQDPVLVVAPADQTIANPAAFTAAVQQAIAQAAQGNILILGVTPDKPETGYGYIRTDQRRSAPLCANVLNVAAFVEKPNQATAEGYLKEGSYYWNAGMFVLKASVWLAAIEQFAPAILQATRTAWDARKTDGAFVRPGKAEFEAIPSESVDYAVMEHCPGSAFPIQMVPLDAGWNDLGAWDAAQRRTRQRTCGRRAAHRQPQHPGARQQPLGGAGGRERLGSGRDRRRRAGDQQVAQPRRQTHRQPTHRTKARRANPAPQNAPPLGLVRQHRRRRSLQGQAHPGQAQGQPQPAKAPPPRRALDRGDRHGRDHKR